MRNKINILGVVIFSLILLSLSMVSSYDWKTFGNSYTPLQQKALSSDYGLLNSSSSNYSVSEGTSTQQPLVVNLNRSSSSQYEDLIIQNGNYLQVYDKNLFLRDEINTGTIVSQFDTIDWNGDAYRDIVGLWNDNSTQSSLRIYFFNESTNALQLLEQINFTTNSTDFSGVRHDNEKAIFMYPSLRTGTLNYTNTFIRINQSGIQTSVNLTNQRCFYNNSLAYIDIDGDGIVEYGTFCPTSAVVFEQNGNIQLSYINSTSSFNPSYSITDMKFYQSDLTSSFKVAIGEGHDYLSAGTHFQESKVIVKKQDNSTYWSNSYTSNSGSSNQGNAGEVIKFSVFDDYDGDGLDDLAVTMFSSFFTTTYQNPIRYLSLKGTDGSQLASTKFNDTADINGDNNALTLADMNNDGTEDFLFSTSNGYHLFDLFNNQTIIEINQSSSNYNACIPADINLDGFLEMICSGTDKTMIYQSDELNDNVVINSVSFSPSTTIAINSNLNVIVNATDSEGNTPIYYISKCKDEDSYSSETTNNIFTCSYSSVGSYNVSIGARDQLHFGEYDYFSYIITATQTGTVCGNLICENGETSLSCSQDCGTGNNTITSEDGITISTKIVDTENVNNGLLPDIYYSILTFLALILKPLIVFVFMVFTVLTMLAIGGIVKKIIDKVS